MKEENLLSLHKSDAYAVRSFRVFFFLLFLRFLIREIQSLFHVFPLSPSVFLSLNKGK